MKKYEKPLVDVVEFDNVDIITGSGNDNDYVDLPEVDVTGLGLGK